MLTIIHGNDIVTSRKFFLQEKQRVADATFMQEAKVNLTNLAQVLEGGGLFGNDLPALPAGRQGGRQGKTLFLEHFLSGRRKSLEKEFVVDYLVRQAKAHAIFLWEGKELERGVIAPFIGANIKLYKLPSTLFTLMDAIKPGNGKALIQLFHSCLETTEAEMVFFMLIRQFRLLIALADNDGATISEVGRMAPWQRGKVEVQAKLFETSTLIDLYSMLFEIETLYKTGGLTGSLVAQIDFFLLNV